MFRMIHPKTKKPVYKQDLALAIIIRDVNDIDYRLLGSPDEILEHVNHKGDPTNELELIDQNIHKKMNQLQDLIDSIIQ